MYSMVTIIIVYLKFAEKLDLNCSHYTHTQMAIKCDNHFIMYTYIISSCCTP